MSQSNVLNTLVLLLIINLALGAVFFFKDQYRQKQKMITSGLFYRDGSPIDNGKRLKETWSGLTTTVVD